MINVYSTECRYPDGSTREYKSPVCYETGAYLKIKDKNFPVQVMFSVFAYKVEGSVVTKIEGYWQPATELPTDTIDLLRLYIETYDSYGKQHSAKHTVSSCQKAGINFELRDLGLKLLAKYNA